MLVTFSIRSRTSFAEGFVMERLKKPELLKVERKQ